jgi:hypothetical protein
MNAVMGFSEIMKNGCVSIEESKHYSEIICSESENLMRIFNELLVNLKEISACEK